MNTRRSSNRAEITVETEEVLVVREGQASSRMLCPSCRTQVAMVGPEAAARIAGVSTRTLYRWIEAGKVHFCEPENGILRVCSGSLAALLESRSEKV